MLLEITVFLSCSVTISATESYCEESLPTIAYVNDCPRNWADWIERAQKKRCDAVSHDCTEQKKEFVYHCLLNEWGNATLEVCAPERLIIGNCGEYNPGRASIQDSLVSCKSCPGSYSSRNAYLYAECYDHALKKKRVNQEESRSEPKQSSSDSTLLGLVLGGIIFIVIINLTIAGVVVKFYQCFRKKSKNADKEKYVQESTAEDRKIKENKERGTINLKYTKTDTTESLLRQDEVGNETATSVTCTEEDANSVVEFR